MTCTCGAALRTHEGPGRPKRRCDGCLRKKKREYERNKQKNAVHKAKLDGALVAMQEMAMLESDVERLVQNTWEGGEVLKLIRNARRRVAEKAGR